MTLTNKINLCEKNIYIKQINIEKLIFTFLLKKIK
jgi:hypothetical protein